MAALVALNFLPLLTPATSGAGTAVSDVLFSDLAPTSVPTASPPATSITKPPATSAAVPPTAVFAAPPAVPIETSCPNPGMGWVASFGWPGDLPARAAGYSIRWQLDGGPIIRHGFGGWTDPAKPQVAMRIPNGAEQVFFTDYLDADGQILASTEQLFEVSGDC